MNKFAILSFLILFNSCNTNSEYLVRYWRPHLTNYDYKTTIDTVGSIYQDKFMKRLYHIDSILKYNFNDGFQSGDFDNLTIYDYDLFTCSVNGKTQDLHILRAIDKPDSCVITFSEKSGIISLNFGYVPIYLIKEYKYVNGELVDSTNYVNQLEEVLVDWMYKNYSKDPGIIVTAL
jgi:hypothetical protein